MEIPTKDTTYTAYHVWKKPWMPLLLRDHAVTTREISQIGKPWMPLLLRDHAVTTREISHFLVLMNLHLSN